MNNKFLFKILINIIALLIVSYIVPGFYFSDIWAAFVTAVVFGVANTYIKPVLQVLFLPVSVVTLGIGAFLINVFLLWGVSFVVPGFEIANFLTAAVASIALALISIFLHKIIDSK